MSVEEVRERIAKLRGAVVLASADLYISSFSKAWSDAAREASIAARQHRTEARHHEEKAANMRGRGLHGEAARYQRASKYHKEAADSYATASRVKSEEAFHSAKTKAHNSSEKAWSFARNNFLHMS